MAAQPQLSITLSCLIAYTWSYVMHFWTPIDRNDKFSTTRPRLPMDPLSLPLYIILKMPHRQNVRQCHWRTLVLLTERFFALSSISHPGLLSYVKWLLPWSLFLVNPQISVNIPRLTYVWGGWVWFHLVINSYLQYRVATQDSAQELEVLWIQDRQCRLFIGP